VILKIYFLPANLREKPSVIFWKLKEVLERTKNAAFATKIVDADGR
jgi:hypothetical protein